MLIVCPTCATSYNLTAESLGASGRSVRCVRCQEIWHAEAPREAKLLAAVGAMPPEPVEYEAPEDSENVDVEDVAPHADEVSAQPAGQDDWYENSSEAAQIYEQSPDEAFASDGQHDPIEVEAPPIVPVDLDQGRTLRLEAAPAADETDASAIEDIETLAARRSRREARRRRLSWPLSRLQTAMLALIIFDATLIGWRGDIVRLFPQTASFYATIGMPVNLRGLAFDGIATTKEQHEGVPVLVVEGNIVNVARKPVEVPRLKFSVRNDTGNEIYSWTMVPPRTVLPSGESLPFRSRLASPPPEGRDVLVRFFARRDLVAGVR
jgi:predicted Zn finger-like uncharacterized protein